MSTLPKPCSKPAVCHCTVVGNHWPRETNRTWGLVQGGASPDAFHSKIMPLSCFCFFLKVLAGWRGQKGDHIKGPSIWNSPKWREHGVLCGLHRSLWRPSIIHCSQSSGLSQFQYIRAAGFCHLCGELWIMDGNKSTRFDDDMLATKTLLFQLFILLLRSVAKTNAVLY